MMVAVVNLGQGAALDVKQMVPAHLALGQGELPTALLLPDVVCYAAAESPSMWLEAHLCSPAGLCHAGSRVLVSFELRSSAVKETFLAEAHRQFAQVTTWSVPAWEEGEGTAGACNLLWPVCCRQ